MMGKMITIKEATEDLERWITEADFMRLFLIEKELFKEYREWSTKKRELP